MKIDNTLSSILLSTSKEKTQQASSLLPDYSYESTVPSLQDKASSTTNLELTSLARTLQALEDELKTLPEMDLAKVADIKAKIERGEYAVDPQRLAQKLLALEDQ